MFRDVVDCRLFYWTYARKLHGHGHYKYVVCYNDALNFVKACCAVNPQVRVLPGYRNYFMRLGYRQDRLHALSELFYIVAAITVVNMQSKFTEVCRYFCRSKIGSTFLGQPLPHSCDNKLQLSSEMFQT